jgi:hypothetical protein
MIDATLRFMPWDGPLGSGCVLDHRNGLLLYINVSSSLRYVCNPATRRWIELPAMPFAALRLRGSEHLVFDPIVSLHYDVLFFPEPPREHGRGITKHAFERGSSKSALLWEKTGGARPGKQLCLGVHGVATGLVPGASVLVEDRPVGGEALYPGRRYSGYRVRRLVGSLGMDGKYGKL